MNCLAALVCALLAAPAGAPDGGKAPGVLAASRRDAKRIPVAVLVPVSDPGVPEGLGLAIQERAVWKLLRTDGYAVLHARQLAGAATRHRVATSEFNNPAAARVLATRAGANTFVYASLKPSATGWQLRFSVGRVGAPGDSRTTLELPRGEAFAVEQAATALATAIATLDGVTLADPDAFTSSNVAMREEAACAARLARQPIGLENPTLLEDADLKAAVTACETAVQADVTDVTAWASLALAAAIAGDDTRAIDALGHLGPLRDDLPNAVLARFWLVSRYQSDAAAEAMLVEVVNRQPGQLLLRSYLAEYYAALGRWVDAEAAWKTLVKMLPRSPFALSQQAWALSRLGELEEGAALAKRALAMDFDSVPLRIELAACQVNAEQFEPARVTLSPLLNLPEPTGEALLLQGFLEHKLGHPDKARPPLLAALKAAKDKASWRTRARAHVLLAQLDFEANDVASAKRHLVDALQLGLRRPPEGTSSSAGAVWSLISDADAQRLLAQGLSRYRQASPLPAPTANASGKAARPAAPQGFGSVEVKSEVAP